MAKLDFSYSMELSLSQPVKNHHFTLRCIPADSDRQTINGLKVEVLPEGALCHGADSFGNLFVYGTREAPHSRFSVQVTGQAVTANGGALTQRPFLPMYRVASPLTRPGPVLSRLCAQLPPAWEDAAARARLRMEQVHDYMRYTPGATTTGTTAEEAAAQGAGVCQDYAHILLALLRMDGISCRYICGMMVGEGASHAWVEAAAGERWLSLDPTNRCEAGEDYIVLSLGRDAWDCTINRGVYQGWTTQNSAVSVRVVREEEIL